ncbi:bifunctional diaminohydroxyphosphoribosylaminopyrimidine deaminase/5-amino-6-(5-phosphoribosylamino)uracil reductase RibD [Clostridium sp. AWRP]|uniref:bifunctional diaminohydroxyphosphoribosylaminopyrimidine deaminase/5-amino-6-(5-phosphoribosylamino)uracil reductase RibD n=1 Tax=Clostridium sp. AWRP TaxID=2212991 RepID=UPI000FD889A6|nr:bifunctional diaminohydroxyphosphoribosylaminopyrimidine deaminase/5-amino-6-(5-phosphoribosylamino)uracil reductase RibD [Clostridium sp. AWRP]AZV59088.1 bifunctional diaminohydroxyphosphoribosylaminopyrimidine deaminase/5-amino-6-(5-phosphoribosylamino)uracil reductase RibD [Clostridium sp. AWRP]
MEKENTDEKYMKEALKLALLGRGFVNPNPLVGAVIVKNGKIIGKGYHSFFGGPHAEIYALREAGDNSKGADLYVTLEPCSHYGKTPPCAKAIVEAGIKRVVIGSVDPNPLVSGRGVKILKDKNIEVVTGVMEREAVKINEIFMNYIKSKVPFVILKSGVTLDGKIATVSGESKWITGEESRLKVHKMRNRVMAIMVGVGTVILDDPLLTTRLEEKCKSPKAVIVDSKLRVPVESQIFKTSREREIIIACTEKFDKDKAESLKSMGVNIVACPENREGRVDLKYLTKKLGEMGIDSVLVEGGAELNFSAIKSGIVNKVIYFIAPKILGGKNAKTSVEGYGIENLSDSIKLKDICAENVGEDIMIQAYVINAEN